MFLNFLSRRSRAANQEPIPPCPACATTSGGREDIKGVITVTALCQNCQKSSSSISDGPAPAHCGICQQINGPFPEASPWDDSITPPAICIACIEQSLSSMSIGEHRTDDFAAGNSQAGAHRKALRYLPCVACHRPLPSSAFPDGHIVESCRHEPEVCLDCIEKAIIESLDNDLPQCVSCPQCGEGMSVVDVWRFSGTGTFKR
jgi:hypothetical protein